MTNFQRLSVSALFSLLGCTEQNLAHQASSARSDLESGSGHRMSSTCTDGSEVLHYGALLETGEYELVLGDSLALGEPFEVVERVFEGELRTMASEVTVHGARGVDGSTGTTPERATVFLDETRTYYRDDGTVFRSTSCGTEAQSPVDRVRVAAQGPHVLVVQHTRSLGTLVRAAARRSGDFVFVRDGMVSLTELTRVTRDLPPTDDGAAPPHESP